MKRHLEGVRMSQNVDWHFWMGMGTVKLWQGCALVTGLNPDTLRWDLRKRVAGPSSGPLFEGRSFPSAEAKAKFERALRLADNKTSYTNGPIYPQGPLRTEQPGSSKAKKEVLLSEVIAFFVSCKWPEIPEALQSLASQPVALATEPKQFREDRRLKACFDAGLPMNKAALSRLPDGVGKLAAKEGVSRQSFSTDIKAALGRKLTAERAGGNT